MLSLTLLLTGRVTLGKSLYKRGALVSSSGGNSSSPKGFL